MLTFIILLVTLISNNFDTLGKVFQLENMYSTSNSDNELPVQLVEL